MCHWFDSGSGHYFFVFGALSGFSKGSVTEEDGLLAQAVEHLTFNQGVAGSSPAWLSKASDLIGGLFFGNHRIAFFVGCTV